MMKVPSKVIIEKYLKEAKVNNQGPWDIHSRFVGDAAKLIADKCPDLDGQVAYAMGALHDIGRRDGVSNLHHTINGYNFLIQEGYPDIAQVCLSHSFPCKTIHEHFGKVDCNEEEVDFIKNFLRSVTYTDYDRLIQLCDALATHKGFVLMEKRMVDVALRYGMDDFTKKKWQKTFDIKAYFEDKIGTSVYDLLPGVVENTFD